MKNKHKNKKAALILLLCFTLSGCRKEASPAPVSPAPIPSPTAEAWQTLPLPDVLVAPAKVNGSLPDVSLLGTVADADIFLYGLSEALGGGVLLCCGQQRVHFEQRFFPQDLSIAQLPVLYWKDFDGDGQSELAVKYHTGQDESGGCTYDLVFYRPNGETWSAVSASQSFCAEAILKEINTSWNERTNTCTLSCSGQQVLVALPADTAPGRLVIGHLCLFTEEEGQFTVICDAWFPVLSDSAAIFRAQIIYDGISVALQNIHMDSFSGV